MVEALRLEVRSELTVDHVEHVAVEGGGDAGSVVVRRLEHVGALDEVGTEQQVVLGPQAACNSSEESSPGARREVADRAAEERDDSRTERVRHARQVALVVADDAVDGEARVFVDDGARQSADHGLRDIDRHVALQRADVRQGRQQQARLRRCAAAQLDELRSLRRCGDRGSGVAEDRALGAGGVVLRELTDALEELAPNPVVEMLGGQLLERTGEPVEHVVGEGPLVVGSEQRLHHEPLLGDRESRRHQPCSASSASRSPAKICRR